MPSRFPPSSSLGPGELLPIGIPENIYAFMPGFQADTSDGLQHPKTLSFTPMQFYLTSMANSAGRTLVVEFLQLLKRVDQLSFAEQEAVCEGIDYHLGEYVKRFPPASIKTYNLIFSTLKDVGVYAQDKDILEIGTGFNLGVLFLAGLSGARQVVGVEAFPHTMGSPHDFILSTLNHLGRNPGILITPDQPPRVFERFAEMVAKDANGRYSFRSEKLQFLCPHRVTELPFPANRFDLVYTSAAFEHFRDPEAAVKELARVTRTGGLSFHCVDLRDHQDLNRPFEFLKCDQFAWDRFFENRPGYSYTNRLRHSELIRLFSEHGFSLVHERPYMDTVVTDEMRVSFVEPFRSMSKEELGVLIRFYCFRKS